MKKTIDNNRRMNRPEILAPVGTGEALKAAVAAGCDAVYLGGNLFSARAFAGNFSTDELVEVIDFCHLFGVKVYMTVNTLLKEEELTRIPDYMRPFYLAGLDGVIVQDVGVVRVLRKEFPDMPVHGSTQMSIGSAYGAEFLKQMGLTRVVPARELSLEEIRSIRSKTDIEIEAFVHGAMCYAYSGKCLLSSFMGGRSGNRGRCAQPCRQIYSILSGGKNTGIKEYALSLKDMCTLEILPELIDSGIVSFKIEGRMKNPSYVASTVDAYRQARDRYLELLQEENCADWKSMSDRNKKEYLKLAGQLTDRMQDIYNRGGFYTGYYYTEKGMEMTAAGRPNHMGLKVGEISGIKGPDVFITLNKDINPQDVLEIAPAGVEITSNKQGKTGTIVSLKGKEIKKLKKGMAVYRTRNNFLLEEIDNKLIRNERKIKAEAVVTARAGSPLKIELRPSEEEICRRKDLENVRVILEGSVVEKAGNRPTDMEQLMAKLSKTGGSNVQINGSCLMDPDIFVPMSEFNNMRRDAIEQLKNEIIESCRRQ